MSTLISTTSHNQRYTRCTILHTLPAVSRKSKLAMAIKNTTKAHTKGPHLHIVACNVIHTVFLSATKMAHYLYMQTHLITMQISTLNEIVVD